MHLRQINCRKIQNCLNKLVDLTNRNYSLHSLRSCNKYNIIENYFMNFADNKRHNENGLNMIVSDRKTSIIHSRSEGNKSYDIVKARSPLLE